MLYGGEASREELIALAHQAAEGHGLDPALVKAVCHHESGNWQQWAVRYEPGFYNRYIMSMSGLSQTEKTMRATSFGLMQVMGQVAREFGFDEPYLTALLDPIQGLEYGCKKLAKALKKHNGSVREALLEFNGGGNPSYPDLVLEHIEEYKT